MYYHKRKTWLRYAKFPRDEACPFCNPAEIQPRIVRENEHAFVIPNRTAYDQWELRPVLEHLLLINKRHVTNWGELTPEERTSMMDLLAEYETNEYEVYARSFSSIQRSQSHQHTHLIKTGPKRGRGMFFWKKPYILKVFR